MRIILKLDNFFSYQIYSHNNRIVKLFITIFNQKTKYKDYKNWCTFRTEPKFFCNGRHMTLTPLARKQTFVNDLLDMKSDLEEPLLSPDFVYGQPLGVAELGLPYKNYLNQNMISMTRFFKVLDTIFEISIQGQGKEKIRFSNQGFSRFNLESP